MLNSGSYRKLPSDIDFHLFQRFRADENPAGGYDVQIARAITGQLGLQLVIVKLDWDGLITALNQGQIDAMYETLEATVKEAQDRLNAGESFESLMDAYGCSPALKEAPLRNEGYYITAASFVNSLEYVEGSMMLEQPGQVSAPLRSPLGLHLVQYIGDVTPGQVPLADVRDAVAAEALKQKQTQYYEQQRDTLLDAAQVKYYPERLR